MRDDKTKTIKLTLGKKKGKEVKKKAFLGVYMQNLSEKYRKKLVWKTIMAFSSKRL